MGQQAPELALQGLEAPQRASPQQEALPAEGAAEVQPLPSSALLLSAHHRDARCATDQSWF
jgi:hypothetical protein